MSFSQTLVKTFHPVHFNQLKTFIRISVLRSVAELMKCTIATDRQTGRQTEAVANDPPARGKLQLNEGSCEVKEPEEPKLFQ